MLWIALHLPALSLESFAATLPHDAARPPPLALLDGHAISAANAAARALGVKPGLKRATALALAPHITLGQADPQRDAQALSAVAHAALAFTPTVVIQPPSEAAPDDTPHTVLLEVQASLRYFGGLPVLLKRLHQALAPLGHRVNSVSAARRSARRCSRGSRPGWIAAIWRPRKRRSTGRRSGCSAPAASTGRRCRAWACAP
ncbi:hypothetical protein [Rhizobacter sp. Root404]|uniref:Y-family DNA polymerase n=1 Tax=Rhizobacter sp. Root404 TaxID=1736528 RepID=UPI000A4DBA41|nr:hypothetical protein [Rhizobacter sp. Root404]